MTGKKWVIKFLIGVCMTLMIMGIFIYVYDPYNYYRMQDNKLKYVASAYINAGIIKNTDYDTVIIGSSVSQNFDMQLFREKLRENPVKINTGGISLEQRDLFYKSSENINNADKYYIEVSLSSFNAKDDLLEDTPTYLYDTNMLNDYQYLYGYQTWFRGMPISIAYKLLDLLGVKHSTMHNLECVDYVGEWYYRKPVGRDIFMKDYLSGNASISKQDISGMYERMINNVDKKLTTIISETNEYVFYFPPYSVVFWCDAQSAGYAEIWYKVKEYIINKLLEYPNVEVYDFQYTEEICDLEHYRDVTHYGKELNDWMTDCFASKEYRVDRNKVKKNIEKLYAMVNDFRNDNNEWIR